MQKFNRCISLLLVLCMLACTIVMPASALTITAKPANGTTKDQPFLAGTGGSNNFRIPGIVTLDDGTLVATTDARWNGTADAGGLDTLVSVSRDNGANWTYTFANYLGDNGDTWINTSSCIIDPAIGTDGTTLYMIADLYPAGFAINSARYAAQSGSTGFDANGNLLLRDDSTLSVDFGSYGYETAAKNATYGYYLKDGKIYTTAGTEVAGYSVDAYFNLTGNGISTNLFFSDSPYKPFPTDFLYLTTSTDGLTWSEPTLLNLKEASEQSLLVGPGNGTYDETTERMVFAAYDYTFGYQRACVIWRETDGTWHRTEDVSVNDWSSEASVVVLDDGTLRCFYRDGYSVVRYTDFVWSDEEGNYVRDDNATEVSTNAPRRSNNQLSAIKYSQQINGKDAILVACASNAGARSDGYLYVFLVDDDNSMELAYSYDIIPGSVEGYAYNCITEMDNGDIALLYEGDNPDTNAHAEIIFTTIDMDDVTVFENDARLNFIDVELYAGHTYNLKDTTGNHSYVSEYDTTVATVTATGKTATAPAATGMNTGTKYALEDCLYTLTATDNGWYLHHTLSDGTEVYIDAHAGSGNGGYPNRAYTTELTFVAGSAAGTMWIKDSGGSLHLHKEAAAPYWNQCTNPCGYRHDLLFFRPAESGETESAIFAGFVQVTNVADLEDGGQYLIAAYDDAQNLYILNPVQGGNSATSNDQLAKVTGDAEISSTIVSIKALAVGTTRVQVGTNVYNITVSELPAVEIEIKETESTSFDLDGVYTAADVTGLDTDIATVELETVGDSVTYAELRDTANYGAQIDLADSEYTFAAVGDGTWYATIAADGSTYYVRPNSKGHSVNQAALTLTFNDDGSVYLKDSSHYLYVNRSTLAWDRTGTVSGFEPHVTFYLYGAGEDASSAIPGYQLITSADEITSGEGYLIAFYGGDNQLYVMNATTRTANAYNQMAAVVTSMDNAVTTVTVTGVAEGETSMELAGTKYNITVLPEFYDSIAIPETENVYQGPAVTITEKPANGTTQGQPFAPSTGGSTNFRIPGIVTLNDGTLIATTDARWNHAGDGAGLDTLVSVSTDNGANWTYTFANYLGDNGNTYNNLSTCIIDPGIGTDGTTAYMIADLWPAGIALNTSKYGPVAGENGFDDNGNLLLRDLAGDTVVIGQNGYNTMAAAREYNYYLDLETYKIHTANGTHCAGFTVDEFFNISYTDAAGTTHKTNLFFADSPFQPYPTDYLYLTTSTDGLNWSEPELLDLQAEQEQSFLVGPGNGTYDAVNGNMIFTAYRHTGGASGTAYECSCLIWMDENGNWHRSEDATVNFWSSEATAVVLDDGTVRVFYRDGYSILHYTDYQWSESAGNYVRTATEVNTAATVDAGCQLTSIKYSQQVDGKDMILVAGPTAYRRIDGRIYAFLVGEDNSMELAYAYDIVPDTVEVYAYSCITEMEGGDIALLYEGDNPDTSAGAEIIFTTIDLDDLVIRDNDARLDFVEFELLAGKTFTYTDNTGYYKDPDLSELDTSVATVTATGEEITTNAAQVLGTGANIDLDDCRYTFTADGDYFVVSNTVGDTTVYLNHYLSTGNNTPNITTAGQIAVLEGTVDGMFRLQAQVQEGGSGVARTLHFHAESATPYWNRCGNDTSYKCQEYLFRKAESGETASAEIPGYVQLTEVSEVEDGGQYLIAAKNDAGNWFVLNPTTSTASLDHVAQVVGSTTVSYTELTFTGVGDGYTEVQIGSTVYKITGASITTVPVTVTVGETITVTEPNGNNADADTGALDTAIATVTLEGIAGTNNAGVYTTPVTELKDGTYVILNTRARKLVNNTSAAAEGGAGTMNGLGLKSDINNFDAAAAVWTIKAVAGGYTVQDSNGKYMTIGSNMGGLVDNAAVLTIAYTNGTWTLYQNGAYLNDAGGAGTTASGWQNGAAATDSGSRFDIYAVSGEVVGAATKVTFAGVAPGTTSVLIGHTEYVVTVNAPDHEHAYNKQVATEDYLVSEADCETAAIYRYSCECGEDGEESFFYGEALGHDYVEGVCSRCGAADPDDVVVTGANRLSGSGRCETAYLAADELKAALGVEKFDAVIIASGDNFADALAGSYLAAVKGAPILLYRNGYVDDNIGYVAENLAADGTVYILGGTAAVPEEMETALKSANFTVERIKGANRFETNLAILEEAGVGDKDILVATGYNFADSLSASATGMPILLVHNSNTDLTETQKAFLEGLNGNNIVVIGGTGAVNEELYTALEAYGDVERVKGSGREATSVAIAAKYFEAPATAVVAYSRNFPDGLCGGPLAYALGAPLLLTNTGYENITAAYTADMDITDGFVLGGTAAVSDEIVRTVFAMADDAEITVKR